MLQTFFEVFRTFCSVMVVSYLISRLIIFVMVER